MSPNDELIMRLVAALLLKCNAAYALQRTRCATLENVAAMGDLAAIEMRVAGNLIKQTSVEHLGGEPPQRRHAARRHHTGLA